MPSPCPAFAPWSGRAFFHGRARVDTNSRSRPVATTRCVCGTWFRNDPRRIGDRWVFGQGSWGRAPARSLPNGDRPIKAVLGLSSVVSRETTQRSFPSAKGGSWGHVSRGTCASSLWSEFDSLAQSGTQGTAPKGANCPNQDCTPPQDVRCAMRAGGPDDTPRGSQNADDAVFPRQSHPPGSCRLRCSSAFTGNRGSARGGPLGGRGRSRSATWTPTRRARRRTTCAAPPVLRGMRA